MIRDFIQGCKNLRIFFKVVWKFRWWDGSYLYQLMIVALREMERGHRSPRAMAFNSARTARDIQIARYLLERISQDNYYESEFWPLIERDIPANREARLRLYKKMDRAKKEDWEMFIKLFRQSERWWD